MTPCSDMSAMCGVLVTFNLQQESLSLLPAISPKVQLHLIGTAGDVVIPRKSPAPWHRRRPICNLHNVFHTTLAPLQATVQKLQQDLLSGVGGDVALTFKIGLVFARVARASDETHPEDGPVLLGADV